MTSTPLFRNYPQYKSPTSHVETAYKAPAAYIEPAPAHTSIAIQPVGILFTQHVNQTPAKTIHVPSVRGAISNIFPHAITMHVIEMMQGYDPSMRETLYSAYTDKSRYLTSDVFFGPDLTTTHYVADNYAPSGIHWAQVFSETYEEEIPRTLKLYNIEKDRRATWQDCLLGEYEHDPKPWLSRFPGTLHNPTEQLTCYLTFQMAARRSGVSEEAWPLTLTPLDLYNAFVNTSAGTSGFVDLTIPDSAIAQIFNTTYIAKQSLIVPHFITVVEVHSNLPLPVSIQLHSENTEGDKTEWLRASNVTSRGVNSMVIHPNTHSDKETQLFKMSDTVREAMFFRWINTTKEEILSELKGKTRTGLYRARGDHYHLDTPRVVTEHSVSAHTDGLVSIKDRKANPYQVSDDAIHTPYLSSFIALDEWQRIKDICVHQGIQEDDCKIDLNEQTFVVRKSIFDQLVDEKFDGPMDSINHVMKVDKPLRLRVSLMNGGQTSELLEVLKNLHPDVTWPDSKESESNIRSTKSSISKEITGPPCYNFSVQIKIQCARLESGTQYHI